MGNLAQMASHLGHDVVGVDQKVYPPMSDELSKSGISFKEGYTEEQLVFIERTVVRSIRSLYTALKTAKLNIESLETAVESSKDALDATKLGYELDSRNLVDLLQAERNYSDTQNRLAQAKYGFIVTSLQFKQAVGLLKPSDIVELNSNF